MWSIFPVFLSFQLSTTIFQRSQPPSRFNIHFQLFERTLFCFQPTSRVQFLCACRWHRKPIASLFRFCISKLLHTFIILDCINFDRVDTNQHANFSPTQTNYFQSDWKLLSCRQLRWYSRAGSFSFWSLDLDSEVCPQSILKFLDWVYWL